MALIVMMLIGMLSNPGFAQVYVNGININELPVTYCLVDFGPGPEITARTYAQVSYGQSEKNLTYYWITDQTGERIVFNSEVDGMNYMARNGWKLVDSVTEFTDCTSRIHYIFKRSAEIAIKDTSATRMKHTSDCLLFMDDIMENSPVPE